jgi:hypothetical protein
MKKTILRLVIALIGYSVPFCAYAQDEGPDFMKENQRLWHLSKSEKMFNIAEVPNISDYVYLKNGKMIFEMREVADYKYFKNLDSVLLQLRQDIAFYKDSLENGIGNVRIDYALQEGDKTRKVRFIKYNVIGDIFVIHHGETEHLKIEQDTIRIVIRNITGTQIKWLYPVQVTFILNNYADIDKVITEKEVIRHAIDTLPLARTGREISRPWNNPSSCIYNPYRYGKPGDSLTGKFSSQLHFVKYPHLLYNEYNQFNVFSIPDRKLAFYANIGTGVVRNTLSPNADIGFSLINTFRRGEHGRYAFESIYISPFFFFDRNNNGGFYTHDNWFINLEAGSTTDHEMLGVKIRGFSVGAGYLAQQSGSYFTGTTIKVFASAPLLNGITVSPELIATNNFKQIFPGINLKVFGIKRTQTTFN